MTTTYSGDPANSTLDQVRFLTTDTGTPWEWEDEEINWILSTVGDNPYEAALQLVSAKAASFASESGGAKSVGDLTISGGESKSRAYWTARAAMLKLMSMRHSTPVPNVSAHTLSDGSFQRGMHDNLNGGDPFDRTRDQL